MTVFIISFLSILIWRKQRRIEQGISEEMYIGAQGSPSILPRVATLLGSKPYRIPCDGFSSLEPPVGKLVLLNGVCPSIYDDFQKGIETLLDSDSCIIGQGSIGSVYKATVGDGITIAVKKLRTLERTRDAEEFEADMRSLDNLRHRNLVMLQGYFLSTTLKLILSEFVPNGTLSDHLHRDPLAMSLTWLQRHTIGLGIARGLVQLHCNHWYVTYRMV